jgi:hypothetical protein
VTEAATAAGREVAIDPVYHEVAMGARRDGESLRGKAKVEVEGEVEAQS